MLSLRSRYFLILALTTSLLFSCKVTRNVPEGKYLLEANSVKPIPRGIDSDELKSVIRQKPNRKLLMFWRFYLNVYNFASLFKDSKATRWLKEKVGEEPVLADPVLTEKTREQIQAYLKSKGFFHAVVTDTTRYHKKKAFVDYKINEGAAYRIEKIEYAIEDSLLRVLTKLDTVHSLVHTGDRYDQDKLDAQRDVLTNLFKQNGYYNFFRDYIHYEADTGKGNSHVRLTIGIKQVKIKDAKDSVIEISHPRFRISSIIVRVTRGIQGEEFTDTTRYRDILIVHHGPLKVLPAVIANKIFIEKGEVYNIKDAEDTYRKLNGLKVFRFINIQFTPETSDRSLNELNCIISLSTAPKQSFSIESRGTQTEASLGIEGNLTYRNKNLFKGAELFELKLKGALEAQKLVAKEENESAVEEVVPFNTIELGPEASFSVPRFLIPFNRNRESRIANPLTSFSSAYNYQKREDYTRTILNFSFGYNWNETVYKKHIVTVGDVNLVKVYRSAAFEEYLLNTGDVLIRNSYKDQLIPSSRYSFIYNDQGKEGKRHFSYFRSNIEFAGNLLSSLSNVFDYEVDEENKYRVFNIRFAQYVRTDVDFRKYYHFNDFSSVVVRAAAGIGKPYGNSGKSLPFVRSFFGGGTSDLRAWRIRELGPGSLPDSLRTRIEQTGDVKLTANLEYRFDIYKYLKAALFYDIGNIWLLEDDPNRPGGKFEADRFYKELAMGTGLGFRFDFSFFIIRIDVGVPVKDPGFPEGQRFRLPKTQFNDVVLNLGIGYPF